MEASEVEDILAAAKAGHQWTQKILISDASGELIDISCSCSTIPSTPVKATEQPERYPRATVYKFPSIYHGIEAADALDKMLRAPGTTPGVYLSKGRRAKNSGKSLMRISYKCAKKFVLADNSSIFSGDNYQPDDCVQESLKKTKTSGTTQPGILSMHGKKEKRKLKEMAKGEEMKASQPKNKRMNAKRAASKEEQCYMEFHVFCSSHDQYWYLSTSSELGHIGHRFEEPQITLKGEKDLSDGDMSLLEILYSERVDPSQISRIFRKMKGKDFGTLLPKTLYNMSEKCRKMEQLAKGISPKMSDAEQTLAQLCAEGISHFVLYHEVGTGLSCYHRKGRKSKEDVFLELHCPDLIQQEIDDIRHHLSLNDGEKLLLLVSLATDEMVRLVQMFPEVWFMDVRGGTNIQKKDLFKLAIRTPSGKTFPGNLTVIPSGQRWVFHCIYKLAFTSLYGEITCSRNRLAICDEDDAEYLPYLNLIKTTEVFKQARLMLCIFHAIWQPFKEKVFSRLPKKGNSKLLTEEGEEWGNYLYLSFNRMCSEHVSKDEFDHANAQLSMCLNDKDTLAVLGEECVNAAKDLQRALCSKEAYLANYVRREIMMALEAMSNSPVESMNKQTKHGPKAVDSNMTLARSTNTLTEGINDRLIEYRAETKRDLNRTNRGSNAPTKNDIIKKIQYLMDIEWDARNSVKIAQVSDDTWLIWDFSEPDAVKKKNGPWKWFVQYHRVWTLKIVQLGSRWFAQCSCKRAHTRGYPCRCFFRLFEDMRSSSVMIQHFSVYFPFYGDKTDMGTKLQAAQARQFAMEGSGIPVTSDMVAAVSSRWAGKGEYPFLGNGTTMKDYQEAKFVLDRKATTYKDMALFRGGQAEKGQLKSPFQPVREEVAPAPLMADLADTETNLSQRNVEMQESVAATSAAVHRHPTEQNKADLRAAMVKFATDIINNPEMSDVDFIAIQQGVRLVVNKQTQIAKDRRLAAIRTEVMDKDANREGVTITQPEGERKRGGDMPYVTAKRRPEDIDDANFHWGSRKQKRGKKQKETRKQMSIG